MKILLTGATGFIGSHLLRGLADAGHSVVCALRDPARARNTPCTNAVQIDMAQAVQASAWQEALAGVEAVINAVGILQQRGNQRFQTLHETAPKALFEACAAAGVARVIQISALGADDEARSAYHRSKKAADDYLAALPLHSAIVQPSLVYGPGGTSARLFSFFASLPLIPVPGNGQQRVQPIHIDDLTQAVVALIATPGMPQGRIEAVGPEPLTLRQFYATLRSALGVSGRARFLPVPMPLMRMAATVGSRSGGMLLDTETLQMLNRGNTGDPARIASLLGRLPRSVGEFASRPAPGA